MKKNSIMKFLLLAMFLTGSAAPAQNLYSLQQATTAYTDTNKPALHEKGIKSDSLSVQSIDSLRWVLVLGGAAGDFSISETEITFAQYDEFCEASGYRKPDDNGWGRGRLPVINVNLFDAQAFCRWLSAKTGEKIRLPDESEWEFAAKGGKKSGGYLYSGSNKPDGVAWHAGNSDLKTHEVGTKQPNELGIYDMSGNVWEWCGNSGAIRGGCWHDKDKYCRISNRFDNDPTVRSSYTGFRIVKK
jgi:formylglycine-generating enzyme required for sulfatase activity